MLAGLAQASFLDQEIRTAVEGWERAYASYRDAKDHVAAGRTAQTLAYMHGMILGDMAVMGGWLARAETLLDGAEGTAAIGWVALYKGMFEADPTRRETQFREALAVARRFGAADLELNSLAYLGATLVHVDRTEEGMLLLDEALAALSGDEVDDFMVLQEVFCQLFAACERAHDVTRADQWIRVGDAIAERRRLPSVSAFCRTHYGGLLTTAGRWPEADTALTEAVRLWALGPRTQRGAALARLATLGSARAASRRPSSTSRTSTSTWRRRRPRPWRRSTSPRETPRSPATSSSARSPASTHQAPPPLPCSPCSSTPTSPLARSGTPPSRPRHWPRRATEHHSPYLMAVAALAKGRVCLASGSGDAQTCLREALSGFARAQMPVEVAHSRLELAMSLVAEQPEVAMAEARAAHDAFERLQAARHVDAAAAVLRSLGVRSGTNRPGGSLLTKREAEVLELLGHGLSNPEIAERLYISRKTAEHHVGNVLSKLGLRGRAEAAAYASRIGSGTE